MKPYAEACERNQGPIAEALQVEFARTRDVLEIGSGTGQHAVYFGARLPHLCWHPSDLPANHPGISAWLQEAGLDNVCQPLALDVNDDDWPIETVDGVFSANTMHIFSWEMVIRMFDGLGRTLAPNGVLALYGPFNFGGKYTAESNARFDQYLRARDPQEGIRNFESLDQLANCQGMSFRRDYPMPSNNQILIWERDSRTDG